MIDMVLGGYKIIELIGTGGMAKVFRAVHVDTGDIVAIKTLPEEFCDDSTYQIRFQREIETIQRMNHPHILPLIDFGEVDKISYIIMPYMSNGTMADRLHDTRLSIEECLRLIEQLGSAIDHAHAQDVIHRDIKPVNIMFDDENNIQLVDFGVAKLIEDTPVDLTGSAIIGTWQYMSPEQCLGDKDLTSQTDIYALGVVLHEMLAGHPPFHTDSPSQIVSRHMSASISLANDLDNHLTPEVKFVILKALARKPSQRHKSGVAMAQALRRALAGSL